MSISDSTIGEVAIAEQAPAKSGGGKPSPNRLITAKADQIESPEPR